MGAKNEIKGISSARQGFLAYYNIPSAHSSAWSPRQTSKRLMMVKSLPPLRDVRLNRDIIAGYRIEMDLVMKRSVGQGKAVGTNGKD